tara:strand:- start:1143 stop:1553 length:411 start_codon:yes stop_codon:yes gene_type:complete
MSQKAITQPVAETADLDAMQRAHDELHARLQDAETKLADREGKIATMTQAQWTVALLNADGTTWTYATAGRDPQTGRAATQPKRVRVEGPYEAKLSSTQKTLLLASTGGWEKFGGIAVEGLNGQTTCKVNLNLMAE